MQYSRTFRSGLAISLASALAACATLPHVDAPAAPVQTSALETSKAFVPFLAAFPEDAWWASFGDETLNALIEEGLRASPDTALAAARIRAADAMAEHAGGTLAPSLSVEGAGGGAKQSYNMGIPAQFVPQGIVGTGKLSAALGFNLDLWGRNRAALAAARSDADAARVDAQQARLLLSTSIATAWVEFSQLWANRDIAATAVQVRRDTEALTAARANAGIDNQSDLDLAQSRHAAARAELAALDEALDLSRNRIAALVGAGPDRGDQLPRPSFQSSLNSGAPANLALDLLGRRPDIVAARLRTEAAAKRVKVAKRDFYPNINLSAVAGLQSLGLSNLFDNSSSMANFGPAVSLPLFDGGRLAGRYRAADAAYSEAVARYDATLINAFREVADALDSRRALDTRRASTHEAASTADHAAALARLRYQKGIANLLQALSADDAALAARRASADLDARAHLLDIALTRALGGGFNASLSKDKAGT
jgi:NodT family efflux transporter outer membrane factor (OMF) lipoprotein